MCHQRSIDKSVGGSVCKEKGLDPVYHCATTYRKAADKDKVIVNPNNIIQILELVPLCI